MRWGSPFKASHRSASWMVGTWWSDHPHIISKGQRYLTCVVDHDTGRLVWAREGRNKDTLSSFFQDLGGVQIGCVDACVGRRRGVDPRGGEGARTAGGALPGSVSRGHPRN